MSDKIELNVENGISILYDALNKANLTGAYSLDEAYVTKTVFEFIRNIINNKDISKNLTINDIKYNYNDCLELLLSSFDKGSHKGVYSINESCVIGKILNIITLELKKLNENKKIDEKN
jgi:hypothetical protein